MPQARLVIPAAAEHARTARLVAGVAAQRAGIHPDVLDDVRLVVAEAVSLAVRRAGEGPPGQGAPGQGLPVREAPEVEVSLGDDGQRFTVTVSDRIPVVESDAEEADLSLPLIQALAEDSELRSNDAGGRTVRLSWSIPQSTS